MSDEIPDDPSRFHEAIAALRARVPMTDAEYETLTEDQRARAFTVAGVAQADLVTEVWEAVESAVKDGTTLDDFKASVGDKLASAWGGDDPSRLETIFRTNVQDAYGKGRYEQMTHPAVLQRRPAWQFSAILDSRTSEECASFDGVVRAADDEWWADHQPPIHFNCRSTIVPLTLEEASDEGFDYAPPEEASDDGFGDQAAAQAADWQPDLSKYPDELRTIIEDRLK